MGRVRKLFLSCLLLMVGLTLAPSRKAFAQELALAPGEVVVQTSERGRVVQQGDGGADGHTTLEVEPPPATASALQLPGDRNEYSLITGEAFRQALAGAPTDARQFDRCVEMFHRRLSRAVDSAARDLQERRIQCACASPENEPFQQSLCVMVNAPSVPGFGTRISAAAAITQRMTVLASEASLRVASERRGDEYFTSLRTMSNNYSAQIHDLQRQLETAQGNQAEVERLTAEVTRLQEQLTAAQAAHATRPARHANASRPTRRAPRVTPPSPSVRASATPSVPSAAPRRSFSARTAADPLFHAEGTVRCHGIRVRGTDRYLRCMAGTDTSVLAALPHVPAASISSSSAVLPTNVSVHARYMGLATHAQQTLMAIVSAPANSGLLGLKCASHGRYFRQRLGVSSANRDATPVTLASFRTMAPAGCGPTEFSLPDHQVFFIPLAALPAATPPVAVTPDPPLPPEEAAIRSHQMDAHTAPPAGPTASGAPLPDPPAHATATPTSLPAAPSVESDPALRAQILQRDDPDTSKNVLICVLLTLLVVSIGIFFYLHSKAYGRGVEDGKKQVTELQTISDPDPSPPSGNQGRELAVRDNREQTSPNWKDPVFSDGKSIAPGAKHASPNDTTEVLNTPPEKTSGHPPVPNGTKKPDGAPAKSKDKESVTSVKSSSPPPAINGGGTN